MRSLLWIIGAAVAANAPLPVAAQTATPDQNQTRPAIEASHFQAALELTLTVDQARVFSSWSAEKYRDRFSVILDSYPNDSKKTEFLTNLVTITQQGKVLVLKIWSTLYARELTEFDIVALTQMYKSGMAEKKILKTKEGKKWRQAQLNTHEARQAALVVAESKMIEGVIAEFEKTYNVKIPRN